MDNTPKNPNTTEEFMLGKSTDEWSDICSKIDMAITNTCLEHKLSYGQSMAVLGWVITGIASRIYDNHFKSKEQTNVDLEQQGQSNPR